jgi:hypothetical protein
VSKRFTTVISCEIFRFQSESTKVVADVTQIQNQRRYHISSCGITTVSSRARGSGLDLGNDYSVMSQMMPA